VSAEAIFDTLGPVLTRWTMGGSAIGDAPAEWRDGLAGDDSELRLLALTGQFLGGFVVPAPVGALRTLPDLPMLTMPPLADPPRPLARRCIKALQASGYQRDFLHLLAARGVTMHPADWVPSRSDDDLPAVYAPLQDWVAGAAGRIEADLSAETWADFAPAARALAFAELRRTDPAGAREMLAAKAAGESSEVRLRLIAALATGLSAADLPYLQSLASDRAPKVKACAASLLARLGHGGGDTSEATELAAFFAWETKGLLRRTRVVKPIALKTPAQRTRRGELFDRVDFGAFARALGTDDPVAHWPLGSDLPVDAGFLTMAARSAGDAVIAALFARLMNAPGGVDAILRLRDRLDRAARQQAAYRILREQGGTFRDALMIADAGCDLDGLIETPAGRALVAAAATTDAHWVSEVQALGLLASQTAAQRARDALARTGLNAADPRLDLLRLNATLAPTGAAA